MPAERINRYKKAARLGFSDEQSEHAFREQQMQRGRSSGGFALIALSVMNVGFALLEHWILGVNSSLPMTGFAILALLSLLLALFGLISDSRAALKLRVLIPGVLTVLMLMVTVFLQQYRIYNGAELALLLVWFGSLNLIGFKLLAFLSVVIIGGFTSLAYAFGATELKLSGLLIIELVAFVLGLSISYLLERSRRILFLTDQSLQDIHERQENWAYTLIDLDMALSGIRDLKQMTSRLMEYLRPVIAFDSYVLTSLEGKGPKPQPDEIDGTLFEEEDRTIWSEDLLTKLSQTRQADASAQFEVVKGFLGREKKKFQHFRLDIPLFSDSNMIGVISLRRRSHAFDDLDMTASVSLASQATMIFKRSNMSAQMSQTLQRSAEELSRPISQPRKPVPPPVKKPVVATPAEEKIVPVALDSTATGTDNALATSGDIDITADRTQANIPEEEAQAPVKASKGNGQADETIVPRSVVDKIKQDSESAKKTITLLSRDNADKVAVDRYRTAAVEGEPLSILLFEVDGLSAIRENDGDQTAYKVFAGIVKHIFSKTERDRDVLGRYGQNGLSVLLPRVDMNAAEKFAESIRQYVESARFKTAYGERKATVSVGVAAITDETGNYESMVKRADMALFVAKKNGRNCVKVRL